MSLAGLDERTPGPVGAATPWATTTATSRREPGAHHVGLWFVSLLW